MRVEVTKEQMLSNFEIFIRCMRNSTNMDDIERHHNTCMSYILIMLIEDMLAEEEHKDMIRRANDVYFSKKYGI